MDWTTTEENCESNPSPQRLPRSKRKQIKKLRKLENRRKARPEVRKRRKLKLRKQRETLLESMSPDERETYISYLRRSNYEKSIELSSFLENAYNNGTSICINCSFEEQMSPKEIRSLAKQISLCYSFIKKKMIPVKFVLTSFSSSSLLYNDCQIFGLSKWMVHIHEEPYWELFDLNDVVVLSPDATEPLEEVTNDKVYVIGGLVDINVKKFEVLNQAVSKEIQCKSLPIKKYVPQCKKTILNVSTVFEILSYRINNMSWEDSLTMCLPVRSR